MGSSGRARSREGLRGSGTGRRSARARGLLLTLALCAVAPGVAAETAEQRDPRSRWTPSISAGIGFQYQRSSAVLTSDLRGVSQAEEALVMPIVPIGLQLEAPQIRALPGSPRIFVHGEFQYPIASTRTLARTGVPGEIVLPDPVLAFDQTDRAAGQGQTLEGTFGAQWVAGIGLAFPATIFGRHVEFRPSLDYMGQSVEFEAQLAHLGCLDGGDQCRGDRLPPPAGSGLWGEPVSITGSTSKIYSALGPRLQVEVDTGNRGPIGVGIFMSTQVYVYLDGGNASDTYSDADGDTLSWAYESTPWVFQASAGLRLSWRGR